MGLVPHSLSHCTPFAPKAPVVFVFGALGSINVCDVGNGDSERFCRVCEMVHETHVTRGDGGSGRVEGCGSLKSAVEAVEGGDAERGLEDVVEFIEEVRVGGTIGYGCDECDEA